MSDTEPDTTHDGAERPLFPWLHRRATAFMVVALLLLGWTILASQWHGKDCSWPHGFQLSVTHFTPGGDEGCDEYGDYTDQYNG